MDDRTTTGESPHELLLALAGRVDDDLLAGCRELVAVGEDGRALELLTATLIADRAALPPAERTSLVAASRAARSDLDADGALAAPVAEAATAHRFAADLPGIDALAAAVGSLPTRLVDACRTWVTFRLTPAGAAPGPLPHPVVVAEVDADDTRPVDVLAYQLAIACARAGAPAAVEVVVAGAPRAAYQSAALRTARAVHGGNVAVDTSSASQPSASQPSASQPSASQPSASQSSVPESSAPESPVPQSSVPQSSAPQSPVPQTPPPPAPWPSQVTASQPAETDTDALPVAAPPDEVRLVGTLLVGTLRAGTLRAGTPRAGTPPARLDRPRDEAVPAGGTPASGGIVLPPAPRPAVPRPAAGTSRPAGVDRYATATQPGAAHPDGAASVDGREGDAPATEGRAAEVRGRDDTPPAGVERADPPPSPVTPLRGPDQILRPGPARQSGTGRAPMPSPARRTGRPLVPVGEQASVLALPIGRQQGVPADGPALASIGDPLLGDPATPAATGAPQWRDTSIDENDPLGIGSLPATPHDDGLDEPASPVADSWLSDWITGDWVTRSGPDPLALAPAPRPEPRAEPIAQPLQQVPPPLPVRRAPVVPPVQAAGQGGFTLKPESVARLSEADRALLARLQAELGERPNGRG